MNADHQYERKILQLQRAPPVRQKCYFLVCGGKMPCMNGSTHMKNKVMCPAMRGSAEEETTKSNFQGHYIPLYSVERFCVAEELNRYRRRNKKRYACMLFLHLCIAVVLRFLIILCSAFHLQSNKCMHITRFIYYFLEIINRNFTHTKLIIIGCSLTIDQEMVHLS